MIRIHGIKISLSENTENPTQLVERQLRLSDGSVKSARIVKESIDAREKPRLWRVLSIDAEGEKSDDLLIKACKRTNTLYSSEKRVKFDIKPIVSPAKHVSAPLVAGFGPCGIFAALALAKYGLKPIVLERGASMEDRIKDVEAFWNGGALNPESNVQFGEGGAGTFSDGKLTTGTKSPYSEWILEQFVAAGAAPEILYKQRPHIGTDVIRKVVVNIRKEIEALGGEVRFGCKLERLEIKDGMIAGAYVSNVNATGKKAEKQSEATASALQSTEFIPAQQSNKLIPAQHVILALGHSARDTIRQLFEQGLCMEPKPFSIGLRIEHPQDLVDIAQYGAKHDELGIGPADYKLNVRTSSGRGVYTFCMCPGGYVINASSAPNMLCCNGMSNASRDSGLANSGLLAEVSPEDYSEKYLPSGVDPKHPLAGVAFQEKYESLAFELGGRNYTLPQESVEQFLKSSESEGLSSCLPDFASNAIKEALPLLGKKMKGFDSPSAVLKGLESRSSSPVRIKREADTYFGFADGESGCKALEGLYPAGEGAGYAGGIMSAAADGIRIAVRIAELLGKQD